MQHGGLNASDRHRQQVVALDTHNAGAGELADLQCFTYLFGWEQFDHTVDFGCIGIRPARAALSAQRRRMVDEDLHGGTYTLLKFLI